MTAAAAVVRRPRALRPGDVVAVVSPCSPVPVARLEAGLAVLASWGLDAREGAHARAAHGHVAGDDAQRAADLNAALRDPAVRAVWVARGGYGMTRLLDRIDWEALARDPKLLIGFSDVTALLVAAWRRTGVVGIHGQFVARLHLLAPAARTWLHDLVSGRSAPDAAVRGGVVAAPQATPVTSLSGGAPTADGAVSGPLVAPTRGNTVSGPLVGGNLAVLAALAGTPDALRATGCVVLLEEVNEAPYAVDRMLTQLRASGALDGVRGVVVGRPVRCEPAPDAASGTFAEVVADRLGDLGVPVLTGLDVGHTDAQWALVHGGRVTLDTAAGTLRLDDTVVAA